MTGPGSSTITRGIVGLWAGSVYCAISRSFWTIRPASERNRRWAPTPVRYSFVSRIVSVLMVTSRQMGNLELTMELNLKLFFCTFALGDIHPHTHNPLQLALLVEFSSTAPLHLNGRPVLVNLIEYLPPASLCRPTNIAATLKNA